MELKGSQTQIKRQSKRTRQSMPQCNLSLSSPLTTKMWRQCQTMLSSGARCNSLPLPNNLLLSLTARVYALGSSISMW